MTEIPHSTADGLSESRSRQILATMLAFRDGNFSVRLPTDWDGIAGQIAAAFNQALSHEDRVFCEVERLSRAIGRAGQVKQRMSVPGAIGGWAAKVDHFNTLMDDLVRPTAEISRTIGAVARGDLGQSIELEVDGHPLEGEFLRSAKLVNTMIEQLSIFTAEVTRVAREVGTEGKLGGQALVSGAAGTWKDLTDSVNSMAANVTGQVRNIADVAAAIAGGDLSRKITVDAKGEILQLKETVNTMVDQLNAFAAEVTRVAREVGTEGKLGGQAQVPGVAGTWKALTDNVNQLAANLTTQVRAIAEVATAVTHGDLTRSIKVETSGEVADLKDNINTMIFNLRQTTDRNREQDWLKTNIAKFAGMCQGQRDLGTVGRMLLSELCPLVSAHQGTIYHLRATDGNRELHLLSSYANTGRSIETIRLGDGLVGQCALEKKRILLSSVPPQFITIASSLGQAHYLSIVVLPILFEGETKAVIELATLHRFTDVNLDLLDQLTVDIGAVFHTIEATMRTERLLEQSQRLAVQLQARQDELERTNEELAAHARLLAEQNAEVERKNAQVEQARFAIQEQADQLSATSKYKSEFLANMSHELRTPLNSILIFSEQLAANRSGNLSDKEVEFSQNINSSGSDLLHLIDDVLDLSKIESGTVTLEIEEIPFGRLTDNINRTFADIAEAKKLPFSVELADGLPRTIESDHKRLLQILKNLVSNAVKFTVRGHVSLRVGLATAGWSVNHPALGGAQQVVAFTVNDTGVGIAPEKQKLIFEAFQQADAGTSRRYGGTGLGLAISRELASLLNGEIKLTSIPGQGSTFTLYLPLRYSAPPTTRIQQLDAVGPPSEVRNVIGLPTTREYHIEDDREEVVSGEPLVLIIENDPHYARLLLGLARDKGFKGIAASNGSTGLALARAYRPTAISLDIVLPDMLGWAVLRELKLDPNTRHIPVQITTVKQERQHDLAHGAFAYYVKEPTTDGLKTALDRLKAFTAPRTKRLLIIEDNEIERQAMVELLDYKDIEIVTVSTGTRAIEVLTHSAFDCMVLDLRLPDMTGFELLEQLHREQTLTDIPVVVFTGKELTATEQAQLRQMAKSIVVKHGESSGRLLDETALFLHRVVADLPEEKQAMLERIHGAHKALRGRKALVVDDDARNIFALASLLENQDMEVFTATSGRMALEIAARTPDLSIVLIDIMMPDLDGYETIRNIREDPRFGSLPILALTAKAMTGDREKCIEAGASDYISKPVNTGRLLSLMRVWLSR